MSTEGEATNSCVQQRLPPLHGEKASVKEQNRPHEYHPDMARVSDGMLVLRAVAVMLVFPMRLLILVGLILAFAGERVPGLIVLAGGIVGYALTVKVMRVSKAPRRGVKNDPNAHLPGEVRSDRISYGLAERGTFRRMDHGQSALSHRRERRRQRRPRP